MTDNNMAEHDSLDSQVADEGVRLFELDPETIEICLRVKGVGGRHELRHRLQPPRLDDWRDYERNLRSTVEAAEHVPDALQFDSAPLEAAAVLYDKLFIAADGYRLLNCTAVVDAGQIPIHHKEMVIRALSDVGVDLSDQNDDQSNQGESLFSLDPERVAVTLQAQLRDDTYRGLTHFFKPPSTADRMDYSRVISQALYVRGSQSLKTLLPARLPGLVALYDRLILSTRGYCVRDVQALDRSLILKHMDPLHKKVAVQLLFEE